MTGVTFHSVTMHTPTSVPSDDWVTRPLASVRDLVDAWSAHDAPAELVTMFGGAFPADGPSGSAAGEPGQLSSARHGTTGRAHVRLSIHGGPVRCQDSSGGARG